jgi:hypothetical protein
MSWTWYSNTPPSYPILKPVKLQPPTANGKPKWREWGKSNSVPLKISLKTEPRTADQPPAAAPRPNPESVPQNGQTLWILEQCAKEQSKRKGNA